MFFVLLRFSTVAWLVLVALRAARRNLLMTLPLAGYAAVPLSVGQVTHSPEVRRSLELIDTAGQRSCGVLIPYRTHDVEEVSEVQSPGLALPRAAGALRNHVFLDIGGYLIHATGIGLAKLSYPLHSIALNRSVRSGVTFAPDNKWTAETQVIAAPEGLPPIKIIDEFGDVWPKLMRGWCFSIEGQQLQLNCSVPLAIRPPNTKCGGGVTLKC